MTIGERIKAAREAKGATLEEVANAAHTIKQTIYKYEKGVVTNIPSDKIEAIASFLGVTESYLMGWEVQTGEATLEIELLDCFRSLDAERAKRLMEYARDLKALSERNGGDS